jgi:hypothetical protein
MTEPIDEREPARPAVPWPYAPEPPPGGAEGENRPVQPAPPVAGWVPPDASAPSPEAGNWVVPPAEPGSGQARGCLKGCVIVGAIVAILAVVVLVAFIFLGSQVQSALKGTVEFGTAGEACSVSGGATSFKAGTDLHFVALLERSVSAGETLTVVQTFPDARTDATDQKVESAASCMYGDLPAGASAGHYAMEVRSGSEILAKGGFEVTP